MTTKDTSFSGRTYEACYMPATEDGSNPSRGGFLTEREAWEYVESIVKKCGIPMLEEGDDFCFGCMAEWNVWEEEQDTLRGVN